MLAIDFENVSFNYPNDKKIVLDNISVKFDTNNITAIVGHNGSGKSTLTKLCCNIYRPTKGIVKVFSKNTKYISISDVAKDIYYCFQDPQKQLFCESVKEEIAFALKYQKYDEGTIDEIVEDMLVMFNLKEIESRYPLTLSGGEKQRLAIACGVALKPKLMILDEPTSSLDVDNINNLANIILNLNKEFNIGFLIVSHDLDFVNKICNIKYKMEFGGISNEC